MLSSISSSPLKIFYKRAASWGFPQSHPSNQQVPQQTKIGIETLLDPDMPKPELSPPLEADNPGSNNCLRLFYRVNVDALEI